MDSGAQRSPVLTDEEIVRRFQQTRDKAAFAELFARYQKKVYSACRGFFSDYGTAEDMTQEIFLRAYQNMDRFHEGDFSHWLMRIARNTCIDQWRKQRPSEDVDEMQLAEEAAPGKADFRTEARLAADTVLREMRSLPAEQRRCLELKIEGYSYVETAKRLGLTVEAVKSHLQNGRRILWLRTQGLLADVK